MVKIAEVVTVGDAELVADLLDLDRLDDLLVLVDLGRVLQQILLLVQQQKANETN